MKNSLRLTMVALLAIALITSCKTSSDVVSDRGIQKRKYTKGYYLAQKSKTPKTEQYAKSSDRLTEEQTTEPSAIAQSATPQVEIQAAPAAIEQTSANSATASTVAPKAAKAGIKKTKEAVRGYGPSDFRMKDRASMHTSVHLDDMESFGSNTDQLLLIIIAILLPPLAVYLVKGIGTEFWISVLLTLLFWLPGIIYALIIILG